MRKFALVGALFASFVFISPFLAPKAYAQQPAWFLNNISGFGGTLDNSAQNNTVAKEPYDFSTVANMILSWICLISGCSNNPNSPLLYNRSALAGINGLIMSMYANPPARTYYALQDFGQSLGFLPKHAYAQGVGFSGLAPLLGLWKAFRNIAYALLAIVMIVIGFMVMFRRKIDPKTVVTVQNALPRIVITLLLITFSYALVGLLIDIMYLVILLALAIIGNSGIQGINATQLQTNYVSGGLGQLIIAVFSPLSVFGVGGIGGVGVGAGLIGGGIATIFTGPIGLGIGALVAAVSYALGAAGALVSGQSPLLAILSPLLFFIFAIGLLFAVIRIFLMLLGAYMQIILAVILGPIQILLDAVPGANGFNTWITNLLTNLMVFPITIILLALAGVISQNLGTTPLWEPPLLPGGTADVIRAIIGIGIVLQIPTIVNGIKKSFKAQAPISVGVGGAFAPVVGGIQMLGGHLIQTSLLAKRLREEEDRKTRNLPPSSPGGGEH